MMNKFKQGALNDKQLNDLVAAGYLSNVKKENIKPASIDLILSTEAYEIERICLPREEEALRQTIELASPRAIDIGSVLKHNHLYIIRLEEKICLPHDIFGYANPKSTTGRNDIHVRLLADRVPRYDSVYGQDEKELWVVIEPRSYDIVLHAGISLLQLRLFNGPARLNENELKSFCDQQNLLWSLTGQAFSYEDIKVRDNDGSIILTVDMESPLIGFVGQENKSCSVSLDKINHYDYDSFFSPLLRRDDNTLQLKKDCFYLLSTAEALRLPPDLACEMMPMDEKSGEFRSHYAGFIDPGWGYGPTGEGQGRPLTLEIRPFENLLIRPGQPLAKIKFDKMSERPQEAYDQISSNYIKQPGVRLAKQFKNT